MSGVQEFELPNDYTTGQIWLKNGPGNSFESIEVGWMVGSLNKTLNPFFSSYKAHYISYKFFCQIC